MKNIYLIITVITVALFFSACSGDGSFDTGSQKIVITNCETYIITKTNDLLVKDNSQTSIKVVHDANGTKRVCVLSGSAHIIREAN